MSSSPRRFLSSTVFLSSNYIVIVVVEGSVESLYAIVATAYLR
jgi:hypothetical protein